MSLLITATLLSALLIAFGAVALVRRPAEPVSDPSPLAQDHATEAGAAAPALEPRAETARPSAAGAASTPMARLKGLVRDGEWRRALPSLLVIAGVLGVMLFGSLTILFVLGYTGTGVAGLAVAVFTLGRLAYDYARA